MYLYEHSTTTAKSTFWNTTICLKDTLFQLAWKPNVFHFVPPEAKHSPEKMQIIEYKVSTSSI